MDCLPLKTLNYNSTYSHYATHSRCLYVSTENWKGGIRLTQAIATCCVFVRRSVGKSMPWTLHIVVACVKRIPRFRISCVSVDEFLGKLSRLAADHQSQAGKFNRKSRVNTGNHRPRRLRGRAEKSYEKDLGGPSTEEEKGSWRRLTERSRDTADY